MPSLTLAWRTWRLSTNNPKQRQGVCPQTVKKSFREVRRAAALRVKSESSDMCGGFGSLARQGFPARFPGRAESAGETRSVGKIAAGELFRQAGAGGNARFRPLKNPWFWKEPRFLRPSDARNAHEKCCGIRLWGSAPNPGRREGKRVPCGHLGRRPKATRSGAAKP